MSFVPRLRRPIRKDVRFSDTTIELSESEKRKRKEDAYVYLESRNGSQYPGEISSRLRSSPIRSTSQTRPILKTRPTYELLGESPIRRIPDPDSIGDSARVLKTVRRQAKRNQPLNTTSRSGRVSKPDKHKSNGLLGSLSEAGSKLLGSMLFNEKSEDATLKQPKDTTTRVSRWNSEDLTRLRESQQLDRSIQEKKQALDLLQREIDGNTQILRQSNDTINFETRLARVETKVDADSSLTDKVSRLERRQESDRLNYESRLEEMRMELDLLQRNYKRLQKRFNDEQLAHDKEHNELLKLVRGLLASANDSHYSDSESDSEHSTSDLQRRVSQMSKELKGVEHKKRR